MNKTLIIFVKNPIPGKTKTRLAASVGHEKALKMYQQLLDYTEEQTAALPATKKLLFYSEAIVTDDGWSKDVFDKRVQSGPDLGSRMQNALQAAFQEGATQVIIIGSDCPGVTTDLLKSAQEKLEQHEVVLGPATDGGYYLLGMNAFYPSLLQGIAWSTESVATQTRQQAIAAGLTLGELTTLSDVDYLEDWQHYGWAIPE